MGGHSISRLITIVLSVIFFGITLAFNSLAALGTHPFLTTTSNVSKEFDTQITPSGWTFTIWTIIYIWLVLMLIYILSGLCRKNGYGYVYCSPSILPHGFYLVWCLNMGFNVAWLFLWDRSVMIAALIFLILIAVTNYVIIGFSCHGLHIYGAYLNKKHKVDLWLYRVLVQNGVATYATWTTIATLINLTIVLTKDAKMLPVEAATLSLSFLTVVLCVWFVLENSVLDKHVRYILTIYPVVIWALSGNVTKNYNAAAPSRNGIFTVVLLALATALFFTRFVLVIWRHTKQPLYKTLIFEDTSPMEIAERQKKIFS